MTIEQVRAMYSATPFRAFDLHLADRRTLRVDDPEQVAISPAGCLIAVVREDGAIEIVDLLFIMSLSPRPNNRSRRGRHPGLGAQAKGREPNRVPGIRHGREKGQSC